MRSPEKRIDAAIDRSASGTEGASRREAGATPGLVDAICRALPLQ